jgi:hypothetical protein
MIWKSLLGEVFKLVNSFSVNQAFIKTKSPRFSRTFFVVQIFGKRKRHAKTGRGTLTDVWDFWDIGYFWDISKGTSGTFGTSGTLRKHFYFPPVFYTFGS